MKQKREIYKEKRGKKMTTLKEFKKGMRNFFKTTVDREEGETFKSWFSALFEALEEEGSVIKIDGETYIKD